MAKTHVPLRIEPDQVDRLDAIATALRERTGGGVDVTRSDAARAVFAAGLPAMEKQLGIGPEKPSKKSKPQK